MPRIFKSGKELKGNKNSGRKTDAQIVEHYINTGLANSITNEELAKLKKMKNRPHIKLKDIVMPLVLKGIAEKKELSGTLEVKQITGMEIIKDENSI